MVVYRLCSERYTALNGEGARRFGGRWNSPGKAIVYTAESVSLAILETRVHLRAMPADYVLLTISIRDEFEQISMSDPPHSVSVGLTRSLGEAHFDSNLWLPLKVPSVIAHKDSNFLFSQEYAAVHAKIDNIESVWLDPRLWSNPAPRLH